MITINVCIGSACHLKGSYDVIKKMQQIIKDRNMEDKVTVKAAFCLGECTNAVSVKVDDDPIRSVNEGTVEDFFNRYIVER
ncbi:(2Fe-2S) ferredoxin domain-containing protein [Clostridiisalibacter paucivorans]|uniref:(2Fe-2S) ferredoxin domain-containing protein n=1 Tax=Clostridiisalibacter paucivorans TaxID=408753 RepID=UPI00047D625D|nr:NAD(P)H-dependent oxidoreductase subunit E [Clostridiisalibacter paucivorans]